MTLFTSDYLQLLYRNSLITIAESYKKFEIEGVCCHCYFRYFLDAGYFFLKLFAANVHGLCDDTHNAYNF